VPTTTDKCDQLVDDRTPEKQATNIQFHKQMAKTPVPKRNDAESIRFSAQEEPMSNAKARESGQRMRNGT
jgi:hypothetical protein